MSSEMVLQETASQSVGAAASVTRKPADRRIVVVYVIDNMRFGGTELNAVRTAERLDRDRFELRVVCLGQDGPLTERYRAIGVPVVNMPIRSFYGWSMLRSGWRFVQYVRKAGADVVHAHDIYSNIFAAVWTPVARIPVLITSRRWWNALPNRKLAIGSRFAVARSTAVLANSEAVAGLVMQETPSASGKVRTITNFVDDDAFEELEGQQQRRLRGEWGIPDQAVVVGCVARLDALKDHESLLRAFAQVRAREPHTFLVLVGDGELRSRLERLSVELGVSQAVKFTGEIRSAGNLHRGFDISVLSSLSEGFPNTLLEAMAAGKPVVATRVGGSVDAVDDGRTGLLVQPAQPEDLAKAILRLVESPALRSAYGRAGNLRARERFAASHALGSLTDMYRHLVQGGM
jgi:glycosyltransferase involved in cell wall biosynthesis